jgi:hypothetical protein
MYVCVDACRFNMYVGACYGSMNVCVDACHANMYVGACYVNVCVSLVIRNDS